MWGMLGNKSRKRRIVKIDKLGDYDIIKRWRKKIIVNYEPLPVIYNNDFMVGAKWNSDSMETGANCGWVIYY